jgi:hypothetical protein
MSNTGNSNEWRKRLVDIADLAPLPCEVPLERRVVILANRRARKAAKPAYINTDASWRDGVAGIAYDSGALGQRIELVRCADNHETEYLALFMVVPAGRKQIPRGTFRSILRQSGLDESAFKRN